MKNSYLTRHSLVKSTFKGIVAEIGVSSGYFSDFILKNCDVHKLYSVDINDGYLKYSIKDDSRCTFLKMDSLEAAEFFRENKILFDSIYLDANHSYDSVLKELNTYWQLLKPGAIIAGHDFCENRLGGHNYHAENGVVQAVLDFTRENDIEFYVTGFDKVTTPDDWNPQGLFKYISDVSNDAEKYKKCSHQNIEEELRSFEVPEERFLENYCASFYFFKFN